MFNYFRFDTTQQDMCLLCCIKPEVVKHGRVDPEPTPIEYLKVRQHSRNRFKRVWQLFLYHQKSMKQLMVSTSISTVQPLFGSGMFPRQHRPHPFIFHDRVNSCMIGFGRGTESKKPRSKISRNDWDKWDSIPIKKWHADMQWRHQSLSCV